MTALPPIRIAAQVDPAEHDAIKAGMELLSGSLKSVRSGAEQSIELNFVDPTMDADRFPPADIHILSLHSELARPRRALEDVVARWRQQAAILQGRSPLVFLCTIFRNVRDQEKTGTPDDVMVRIRELNLATVRLSHELRVYVIDIDRALSHFGERVFRCDYRLTGPRAADGAGYAIACAILAAGPDSLVDPFDQQNARQALGGLDALPGLIRRREEAREQRTQPRG